MIKIICKNGEFDTKVKGNGITLMYEIIACLTHLIHNKKSTKIQEKLTGFAAMLSIANVFTKSEMLEMLHDACEDKDPDDKICDYFEKLLANNPEVK